MIPQILCYVPSAVKLLGLTTPQIFKPGPTTIGVDFGGSPGA